MAAVKRNITVWLATTWAEFSRATSPLICRCSRPRRWSCSSISRPPTRLASPSHCRCPAAQTSSSNDVRGRFKVKLPRRRFLHLAAGLAALPALPRLAEAQAYPTRSIKLVAPFPPGGSIDLTARLIGQWLTERLGQQLVIEN